jgi:CO dehydrogenase/acetyl-CoA synthase beta subunit
MQLYDTIIDEIIAFRAKKAAAGELKELVFSRDHLWPAAGDRNLVLQSDTAIELGNPANESLSLSIWTENSDAVTDDRITLIGPDIAGSEGPRLPFGKIVLIAGEGFNEDNAYDRVREIDLVRFDISLKGYMMRAASRYMREWSRISKSAVENGFSFSVLGNALIKELKKIDYIKSVEVIFVTSTDNDVALLYPAASQVGKINNAMSKMMEEMSFDCDECEYYEVCGEVSELRSMHKAMKEKEKSGHVYH